LKQKSLHAAKNDVTLARMTDDDRTRWNRRYRSGDAPMEAKPNRWFAAQEATIERIADAQRAVGRTPTALDIACGAGGTVLWLAERGWCATGVDVSDAALALAQTHAERLHLSMHVSWIHADLDVWRPPVDAFDCVTCFYFLERRLWPALCAAVRPGGLLAMQTFHRGALKIRPAANPAYLLEKGELLGLVTGWGWTVLAAANGVVAETMEAVLAQRPIRE